MGGRPTLTVAHVAPVFATVPPAGYGGLERVVEELSVTQAETGEVLACVVASSDSRPTRPLVGHLPSIRSLPHPLSLEATHEHLTRHYRTALSALADTAVDVIHLHGPWGLEHLRFPTPWPVVASVYADTGDPAVAAKLARWMDQVYLVANSRSTWAKAPQLTWAATILEGIRLERYPFVAGKDPYCCFVGELAPEKGCDIAISVARRAGVPLKIVGRRRTLDVDQSVARRQQQFFAARIRPFLDGRRVEYLGELGDERLEVMARASCLLAPIRWQEPFGRAMAEAMACGTPVIAFGRGAAPEVVSHGYTGYLVRSRGEMVAALATLDAIRPETCRAHVAATLNMERTAREYLRLYRRVASRPPG
jgi:glycosyltransferase involved in cell wall biosynthesis